MVGCAIPDLSLYILDRHLEPVPFGVPGEIYVGGEGVALGYLNRAALTAERFIPDRFGTTAGARLYKSGDLGCYHPNGDVEYLGRADDQVKIRGFRVELGEIASVLSGHDAVRECAVIAHASAGDDKRLVAYVVPADAPPPDVAALRTYLQARLPDYMIPQRFILVHGTTGLPLTANGKLDWRAVTDPDLPGDAGQPVDAPPRTELERAIAEVWRDILHVDAVGLHSNFFELGGDSIAIIKTRDQLRERLNVDLPLSTLFRFPTVSALADGLTRDQTEDVGMTARAKDRAQQQIASRARRQRRRTH
jgi:acyl carrier protein